MYFGFVRLKIKLVFLSNIDILVLNKILFR